MALSPLSRRSSSSSHTRWGGCPGHAKVKIGALPRPPHHTGHFLSHQATTRACPLLLTHSLRMLPTPLLSALSCAVPCVSAAACRATKVLCDRKFPCSRCVKFGICCSIPKTVRRGRPPQQKYPRLPELRAQTSSGASLLQTSTAISALSESLWGVGDTPSAKNAEKESHGLLQPSAAGQPLSPPTSPPFELHPDEKQQSEPSDAIPHLFRPIIKTTDMLIACIVSAMISAVYYLFAMAAMGYACDGPSPCNILYVPSEVASYFIPSSHTLWRYDNEESGAGPRPTFPIDYTCSVSVLLPLLLPLPYLLFASALCPETPKRWSPSFVVVQLAGFLLVVLRAFTVQQAILNYVEMDPAAHGAMNAHLVGIATMNILGALRVLVSAVHVQSFWTLFRGTHLLNSIVGVGVLGYCCWYDAGPKFLLSPAYGFIGSILTIAGQILAAVPFTPSNRLCVHRACKAAIKPCGDAVLRHVLRVARHWKNHWSMRMKKRGLVPAWPSS